jgi:magnesium-transporting ATPase (P-type)
MLGGGVMSSKFTNSMVIGQWIIVAGLCIQLVFFGAFVTTSLIFHYRILQSPTHESQSCISSGGFIPRDWRSLLFALYTASALILIRSVYRLIEFAQGNNGYLIRREVFLYVFDAAMMLLVMVVMNIFHPSVVLRTNEVIDTEEPKQPINNSQSAEVQC